MKWMIALLMVFMVFGAELSGQVGVRMSFEESVNEGPGVEGLQMTGRFLPAGFWGDLAVVAGQEGRLPVDPRQLLRASADIPSVYCYDDLAFFCKIEVKLEKAAQIPVRFRLGDVRYVDWLEGKTSAEVK
ncbi:MAG: hypothetical protein AAF990_13705 [Bacteroidota bacterium]